MRRWNGWGDSSTSFPLTAEAREFVVSKVGDSKPAPDISKEDACAQIKQPDWVPEGATADPLARITHAHGHSFPDWLAIRHGKLNPSPDVVVYPETHEEVVHWMDVAMNKGASLIPYGGGTSVVGHLKVAEGDRPVMSLDLSRLSKLTDLNEETRLATFGAGAPGPAVEAQLRAHGYMLGHFPQSWELSTVGGWVVTRSSGQQSLRYGRIEQMFAGGKLATPKGEFVVPTLPASSAGPDLREFVMGSEGRLGVLTDTIVRVKPIPEQENFYAIYYPNWEAGCKAARELAQSGLPLSMLRLSNAVETDTQMRLAPHQKPIVWLRRYLSMRGLDDNMCMMVIGITGDARTCRFAKSGAVSIGRQNGGIFTGTLVGNAWAKNRFRSPYLRDALWESGFAVDTVETAVTWDKVNTLMPAMEQAARDAFEEFGEKVHAFTHLSHVYGQGSSIYSTFVFRSAQDYEQNLERWTAFKARLSETVCQHGGTISHQHGVGKDHAPYLIHEKGAHGIEAIRSVMDYFDPEGMMNPGKLLPPKT